MPLNTNFNVDPYYDDFDGNKNFHRVLFKPGYAVQSRELTQLQTNLQDQIKKFGDHVFKSGSVVTGGQITIQNVAYLNIASTYSGSDISANNFNQQVIINSANTKRAYVLKSYSAEATKNEPITFIINQLYGEPFTNDETIYTSNTDPTVITFYANTASSSSNGNCQSFSVNSGVFYYEGYFVQTTPQSIAVDKYSRTGNALIGFTVSEDIVDYTEDTSLLDPAQSSSNFQAPGADRYKITLTLDNRSLDSTDLTRFIELATIENGFPQKVVQTPIYAAIGDEFARRTFDESGDYVIKNFELAIDDSSANSAFANVSLGAGKAYIKGYEFTTTAPTVFEIPKPRTTTSVSNQRITSDYGYYVFANGMFGNFATNQYSNVDLSILNTGQSNAYAFAGNTAIISNTTIGSAKIRMTKFYAASGNTQDSNNYIYKVFLTDVNTRPIASNGGYGVNATGGSATTIVFPTGFAANNDVYKGLTVRLVGGTTNPSDNTSRIITDYVGSTLTATIDRPYTTAVTSGMRFIVDTSFESVESFYRANSTGYRIASANVSPLSKNESIGAPPSNIATTGKFQPAGIADSRNEPLLLRIGSPNVADNTIRDFSYSYKRLYQGVQFTGATSQALSFGVGESLQAATTESSKQQYYQIVITSPSTAPYHSGQTVPSQAVTIDTASRTVTVSGGVTGMTANVYATINASDPTSKTKTFIKANTILVDPAGGGTNNIFGNASVYISSLDGQTIISDTFLQKRVGIPQYLFAADVHSINAIFDFNGSAVNNANYAALDKSEGSSANVTGRYVLNTGQKDSYYDWGSIILKAGQTAPRGPLLVRYNRFKSTGTGYFDVDSYTRLGSYENGGTGLDYGSIPIFTSQDGLPYKLSDYLDFRPVRKDATETFTANNFVLDVEESTIGPKISEPDLDIITDYEFYLPRIDRVILSKNRRFAVLRGEPSVNPVAPIEPDDAMTLYILTYPAYLNFTSSTHIQIFNNRRYTMRDIGNLDKRIQNLELYTSLSLAELATLNKNDRTVRDAVGLGRPKNGIFVDSFSDKDSADITSLDFSASIDILAHECRGSYNIASTKIFSNDSPSNYNVDLNGPLMMLSSSNTTFVSQNKASKTMNINPFNVINYLGTVKLDPNSDVWKSDNRLEAQNIDLTGGDAARDAWSSIQSTTWGAWNTSWTTTSDVVGQESTSAQRYTGRAATDSAIRKLADAGKFKDGRRVAVTADITTTTTTTTRETDTLSASRTGILAKISPVQLTKSLGDRLLDISIVHYMREKNVLVIAEGFKPFTSLHSFFDNTKVDQYMAKVNRIQFDVNNLEFKTTLSQAETVTIYQASSNTTLATTDTIIGTGGVVLTANNDGYIVNFIPTASFGSWSSCATNGIWVKGNVTGKTYHSSKWYHSTGLALAATSTTITLNYHAGAAQDTTDYVGQTIYIIGGTGKNQSAIISAYNPSTRVVTITGTWNVTPSTDSLYTIGLLETNSTGVCAAVFNIPDSTFRTGEKLLRLIDDEFGNIENSRTNGDASFYASGIVQTKQETSISVFVPSVTRSVVTEEFSFSKDSTKSASAVSTRNNVVLGYVDPLAQTFLINPNQYTQGVVIDSIRVCFKTKDATAPVSCQIRPVVNGYPSSAVVYPFAEKTLTPDKVKLSTIPDITDPNKYTEFKFDVPILLLPGEHCFVLLSNSNGYEAFIAGIGDTDLKTSVKISDQPYTGSLFLSQNGSTWTADQYNDMMFTIQKRVFSTGVGYGFFEADVSGYSANSVYDVMQVMTTDATIANTTIQYDFISEMESGGQHTLLTVVPNEDYDMDDGYGRRILSTTTGNTTFQLRVAMTTTNQDISPMIDMNRLNLLTIENKINNLPLLNSGFTITNSGSGYTSNGTVTLTYATGTVGQGSGAAARAVVSGGVVTGIELTNAGTGYIASPIVTIGGGGGAGATAVYNGEDKSKGGNSAVRYISKKVKLAPGFEAGDLRVYMDAYRPPGSGILVWYKLLSESDPSAFDDNNWYLMTELTDTRNFFSSSIYDYAELTFAPGVYGSGVPDNKITYTSASNTIHSDFTLFAIKVVMYGDNPVNVPKFGQLRVIALPASTLIGTVVAGSSTGT